MSVPKKKKPLAKTKMGRSHQALSRIKLNKCKKCGKPVLPHHVCLNCGTYNDREAIKIKTKLEKEKKKKEKPGEAGSGSAGKDKKQEKESNKEIEK